MYHNAENGHRVTLNIYVLFKGISSVFKKIILWMKTIHYPNKIRSHLVIIVPIAPFTPKSTLKLRSALHIRYSIVIPCVIPYNPKSNNHYNHGFDNTFSYNNFMYSDFLY